jgi:hypothetical protein
MWLTAPNRIGIAAWRSGDSVWQIDARDRRAGVQLLLGDESLALVASDGGLLPPLDEQFVRGSELHLSFPQFADDCEFGFRLVIRPVTFGAFDTGTERAAFEMLVSVQTTLLDSHPTLDLRVPAENGVSTPVVSGVGDSVRVAAADGASVAVLLGPHDAPFTSVIDQSRTLRLRLFGEFLEKGVIRCARPWVIVDRGNRELDVELLGDALSALVDSPLPLR